MAGSGTGGVAAMLQRGRGREEGSGGGEGAQLMLNALRVGLRSTERHTGNGHPGLGSGRDGRVCWKQGEWTSSSWESLTGKGCQENPRGKSW